MTRARARQSTGPRGVWCGQSQLDSYEGDDRLAARTMAGLGVPFTDYPARGGMGWASTAGGVPAGGLIADIPNRLAPQRRPGFVDWVGMLGGQGDMVNDADDGGQQTGAVAYARAIAYRDAADALGFGPFLIAAPPIFPASVYPVEAARLADYRDLILANSGGFEVVVDLHVAPLDDGLDRIFYIFDSIHWTPAGVRAAADLLRPGVVDLLALDV